jgi:hypothetical protein
VTPTSFGDRHRGDDGGDRGCIVLDRLSRGEQILGVSALLLFIISFLKPWASVETSAEGVPENLLGEIPSPDFNMWSAYGFLPKLGVIIALLLVVLIVAKAAGALESVDLPVPLGLVYLGGAALVVLTMLIALIAGVEGSNEASAFGVTTEAQRGLFLYIGILLSLAAAFGAFMHFQGEGGTTTTRPTPPAGTPPPPPGA